MSQVHVDKIYNRSADGAPQLIYGAEVLVGQGITGMSTLALGSVIALLAILCGGYFGMKYLEEGTFVGAFGAVFGRG